MLINIKHLGRIQEKLKIFTIDIYLLTYTRIKLNNAKKYKLNELTFLNLIQSF